MGAPLPPPSVCAVMAFAVIVVVVKLKGQPGDWLRMKILLLFLLVMLSSLILFIILVVYGGGSEILKTGVHCKMGTLLWLVHSDWGHWPCYKGCVGRSGKGGIGSGFCDDSNSCR